MTETVAKRKIWGLDVVRFCATAGIMLYHYFFIGVIQGFYSSDVFIPLAFWGELGVDVFFILSGFVILFSSEGRSCKEFLIARVKRIYPTFFLCSLITLCTGMLMPGTSVRDLTVRWLKSLTLVSDVLWGGITLSNIYWTLLVEVKFYILVAIVIKLNVWKRWKYHILLGWLILSVLNNYWLNDQYVSTIFATSYAGHFCLGLLGCLLCRGERHKTMPVIGALSVWMVFRNCIGYTTWIRGIYPELPYSDIDILFGVLVIVAAFVTAMRSETVGRLLTKLAAVLGPVSYTFFLLHADFGYFIRTQYYQRVVAWFPFLLSFINEKIIMITAVAGSLCLALAVNWVVKRINKLLEHRKCPSP